MENLIGLAAVIITVSFFMIGGFFLGKNNVMEQAFNRGYAVQCIGKIGYYWECDE